MKKSNLLSILLFIAATSLTSTSSFSHVIPQDELSNQIYLSANEALKKVFDGVSKVKREKRKISQTQQEQIGNILQRRFKDQRIEFYTAKKGSQKFYATIGKATANSHPVTEAKFVILIDFQGQLKEIHIMEYRGPQRAEIISRPFLDQFINKSSGSDFSVVTSNKGSTPSVQALSQAVHKILALYKVLYLDPSN
jgi:hypothetical protein